ncbi:MAG: hypothetical protein NC821_03535, partial [Candidatus Omnitrophica bacterium]|nr:hypothetical protein [Candidatus Omnitrophota bacterium]
MRSNFKLSTWGLVCGVVAQLLVFQDVTLARRIRSLDILGGARVVFYTPEGKEIARFNDNGWEINVPEGEKARRLNNDFLEECFKQYSSLVVKTWLNNSGSLKIAGQRAGFGDTNNPDNPYAGLLVEARLVKSLEPGGAVTDLWFLNKDGSRADFARDKDGKVIVDRYGEKVAGHQEFSLIYKAETKELISSYYGGIDGDKIDEYLKNPRYGSLVVKTWLNNWGELRIAGKRANFGPTSNPNNPYAGLLVEARL